MSLGENRKVMENDIYIVKKKISTENFLLKLNQQAHQLEVYKKADEQALRKNYSIRKDFVPCEYTIYEKIKEMPLRGWKKRWYLRLYYLFYSLGIMEL